MRLFWMDGSAYCPMDKTFLEYQGEITLKVYKCPGCGNFFVFRPSKSALGDIQSITSEFISPREIYRPRTEKRRTSAMLLKMKIPAK